MPHKVLHLITSLDRGGAQTMLTRLATGLDRARFEPVVVTLIDGGAMAEELSRSGVRVLGLGMRRGVPSPGALLRFHRVLRAEAPALVESWLYHADLLAVLAVRSVPVLWTLRLSSIEGERRRLQLHILRACLAALSSRPAAVLANSEAGRRLHAQLGYHPRRWEVVPNGFDIDRFRPDPEARSRARKQLGMADEQVLIGMVARVDGMKDHATFLAAAEIVAVARPEARFVLIGAGTQALAAPTALGERLVALGERGDVPALLPALDVGVLASVGEGFPNALGEAMACAVPCIASDVGDAAAIIGDSGAIVPPRDPEALALAMLGLVAGGAEARVRLGGLARQRVIGRYALPAVVRRYEAIYASVLGLA